MGRNIYIACLYFMECEVTKQISYNCSSKEPAKVFENYNNYNKNKHQFSIFRMVCETGNYKHIEETKKKFAEREESLGE